MAFNAYTGYIYSTVGITLKIMYDCINEWMYMNQVHTIQLVIVTHGPLLLFTLLCCFLPQKLLALGNTNEVTHSYMQGINVQDIVQDLQFVEAYLNQLGML